MPGAPSSLYPAPRETGGVPECGGNLGLMAVLLGTLYLLPSLFYHLDAALGPMGTLEPSRPLSFPLHVLRAVTMVTHGVGLQRRTVGQSLQETSADGVQRLTGVEKARREEVAIALAPI